MDRKGIVAPPAAGETGQYRRDRYRLEVLVWDAGLRQIDSAPLAHGYYRYRMEVEGHTATLAMADIRMVGLRNDQALQAAAEVAAEKVNLEVGGLMRVTRDDNEVRWERLLQE